jgi:Helix-turn-helix domain
MDCRTASRDDASTAPPYSREILARTPAEQLGDEVRAFREKRGLSLSQVAGLVFASKSLISAIEHGNRTGTRKLIAAVDVVLAAAGRIEALWPAAAASRRPPGRPSSCPTCQRGRPDVGSGRVLPAAARTRDHEPPRRAEETSESLATQAVALAERAMGRCADRDRFVSGKVSIAGRARRSDAVGRQRPRSRS